MGLLRCREQDMQKIKSDVWRRRGQNEYMTNMKFRYAKFVPDHYGSLHTHCEFCWHTFMEKSEGLEDCSSYGYCSSDGKYWVCEECFHDFNRQNASQPYRSRDKGAR